MFIVNADILNKDKLYYCTDESLKDFLVIDNKIPVLSYVDGQWIFSKTFRLLRCLVDYKNNCKGGQIL
jgi:hypothetical protein